MILKNDYMSCKDYNLMKSLSKCLYTYEFSSKWILYNFKYVSLVIKCVVRSGQFDVYKVLKFWMSFILCKTKPLFWKIMDDHILMIMRTWYH